MVKIADEEQALRKTIHATANALTALTKLPHAEIELAEMVTKGVSNLKEQCRTKVGFSVALRDIDWIVLYVALFRWERANHVNETPLLIICSYFGVSRNHEKWQMNVNSAAKYLGAKSVTAIGRFFNMSPMTIKGWFIHKPMAFYMLAESTPSN